MFAFHFANSMELLITAATSPRSGADPRRTRNISLARETSLNGF